MEKSKRLLTLIAIVTVLTISGIAFAINGGWFTFIFTPDLGTPDITLQEPFTLTSLPDYFQVSVTLTGSGNTGQEHQGSIIIEHDRADGGFWEANGSYELALEHINGTTVETIDVGSFTNLREYETYGNPFIWTSSADPFNYLLVLEIFDVWWALITECIITATVETPGGTIVSEGITVSYGVPYDFTVLFGDPKGFTIVPDVDYEILNVVVDNSSIGPESSYLFPTVTADHRINASFELGKTNMLDGVMTAYEGAPIWWDLTTIPKYDDQNYNTYMPGDTIQFYHLFHIEAEIDVGTCTSYTYSVVFERVGGGDPFIAVNSTTETGTWPLGAYMEHTHSIVAPSFGDWFATVHVTEILSTP